MGTTLPVPNLKSPLVDKLGKLIPPWNSWFQQFSQAAPAVVDISTINPFTANSNGTVVISGTAVTLTRGSVSMGLGTGTFTIPISIGDSVSWTGPATARFLGA